MDFLSVITEIFGNIFLGRLRGEGKPKKYTDEDLVQAKEELDRIYFRQHGVWPQSEAKKDDP